MVQILTTTLPLHFTVSIIEIVRNSDHPDLAQWSMHQGITSLSLIPHFIVKTWIMLAKKQNN